MCGVSGDNACTGALAETLDVLAQNCQGLAILLDEYGLGGTTRERFETERAGSGKGVEHRLLGKRDTGAGELAVREDVEQRLAGAVAGGPHRFSGRSEKAPAAMPTGDDPHARAAPPAPSSAPRRPRPAPDCRAGTARKKGGSAASPAVPDVRARGVPRGASLHAAPSRSTRCCLAGVRGWRGSGHRRC